MRLVVECDKTYFAMQITEHNIAKIFIAQQTDRAESIWKYIRYKFIDDHQICWYVGPNVPSYVNDDLIPEQVRNVFNRYIKLMAFS